MTGTSPSFLGRFCWRGARLVAVVVSAAALAGVAFLGCSKGRPEPPASGERTTAVASAVVPSRDVEVPPRLLYLPDGGSSPAATLPVVPLASPGVTSALCPPEMVFVHRTFCIDRYEASLIDAASGRALSPYYHPTPEATRREYERWQKLRLEQRPQDGRTMPVPAPPEWSLSAAHFDVMAVSAPAVLPNGYLSGQMAAAACERAGKRLCTPEEWVTACRGRRIVNFRIRTCTKTVAATSFARRIPRNSSTEIPLPATPIRV